MGNTLIFVTEIVSTITNCKFAYILNDESVFSEYESWKIKNPGPYNFAIHIMKDNKRWMITS